MSHADLFRAVCAGDDWTELHEAVANAMAALDAVSATLDRSKLLDLIVMAQVDTAAAHLRCAVDMHVEFRKFSR